MAERMISRPSAETPPRAEEVAELVRAMEDEEGGSVAEERLARWRSRLPEERSQTGVPIADQCPDPG